MRIEVGTVRVISGGLLLCALTTCAYEMFAPQTGSAAAGFPSGEVVHFIAAYGLTILSFAAFPRNRRADLVKLGVLVAILAEMTRPFVGHGFSVLQLASDVLGAFAVLIPSFMERFRSLTRADPHEPFSMVYPNDRRRAPYKTRATQSRGRVSGHHASPTR